MDRLTKCTKISIPYGSIKSCSHTQSRRNNKISIPYGSIKSVLSSVVLSCSYVFQFLMVRLKVNIPVVVLNSVDTFQFLMVRLKALCLPNLALMLLFQFLMVRLKVLSGFDGFFAFGFQFLMVRLKVFAPDFGYTIVIFQFLMVRLKVREKTNHNDGERVFQFLMVRLKAASPRQATYSTYISIPYGSIKSHFAGAKPEYVFDFNSLWFD